MFTTTVRLEVEKKIKERALERGVEEQAADFESVFTASPAPEYERSDRYRLVDPVFRLEEIERLFGKPRR